MISSTPKYSPKFEEGRIRDESGCYRLERLGQAGTPSDRLPGEVVPLGPDIVNSGGHHLIVGERGSGMSDLVDWWLEQLAQDAESNAARIAVDVPNLKWSDPTSTEDTEESRSLKQSLKQSIEGFVRHLRNGDPDRAQDAWNSVIADVEKGFHLTLVIDRLGAFGDRLPVFGAFLRMLTERNVSGIRFILLSQSEAALSDTMNRSGLRILCYEWHMPSFALDEITCLAAGRLGESWPEDEEQAVVLGSAILAITGGQKTLVHELITQLRLTDETLTPDMLADAERALVISPPPVCRYWHAELRAILEKDRDGLLGSGRGELLHRLEVYSNGDRLTRKPFPAAERPLYIAGWLGVDEAGTWGFRSSLHREYAQSTIEQFTRRRGK